MRRLTIVVFVIWLFQATQSEAASKEDYQPSLESTRRDCRREEEITGTEGFMRSVQECLLARPVAKFEIEQARDGISDSNSFLMAVLRPEVTEAIKRGAIDYLAMPQSRRASEGIETLRHMLDKELNAASPQSPDESADVFLLLLGFIEVRYDFYGLKSGPVYRLEEEGRRQGIYSRVHLQDWVVYEFASYLAGSHTLRFEARKLLKQLDISAAPPKSYSAKGCKKKILYRWPKVGIPIDSYGGTPGWPETYEIGEDSVHWGVCPDDDSLWVYHYRSGWKKASVKETSSWCEDGGRFRPAGLVCNASGQR